MQLNDYQNKAISTAIYPSNSKILYPTLGLAGEAGEVANKVKKVIRDKEGVFTPEYLSKIASEVGDCLWYIATLSADLGFTLEEIAFQNLEKLNERKVNNKIQGDGDNR